MVIGATRSQSRLEFDWEGGGLENVEIYSCEDRGTAGSDKGAILLVILRQLDQPIFIFLNQLWAGAVGEFK